MDSKVLVKKRRTKNTSQSAETSLKTVVKKMETSLKKDGKNISLHVVIPEERFGDDYVIEAKSSMKRLSDYEITMLVTTKLFELTDVALRRHVSHVRVI